MLKRLYSLIHTCTSTYKNVHVLFIQWQGAFTSKIKKKSTRKFPELNAEGFKISSQGGSGRRIQEGKRHDQYVAYKRLLDKKLGKIKLVFYNYL